MSTSSSALQKRAGTFWCRKTKIRSSMCRVQDLLRSCERRSVIFQGCTSSRSSRSGFSLRLRSAFSIEPRKKQWVLRYCESVNVPLEDSHLPFGGPSNVKGMCALEASFTHGSTLCGDVHPLCFKVWKTMAALTKVAEGRR